MRVKTGRLVYGAQACTMTSFSDLSDAPSACTRNAEWPSATLASSRVSQVIPLSKSKVVQTPALVVTYYIVYTACEGHRPSSQ